MGSFDIPVISLTGDDAAYEETRDFIPGISTGAVKQSLSQVQTVFVPKEKAREPVRLTV